ncbi:hypothetical protein [Ferrimonas kyonanensis]|uniref:hypothetical protein n=1 Tax=Ferrimonas kyonanensis TaxID=364763 RepID=UPI000480348B|nr:hypothetical protein [Ferrimonas kyonanensis]
MLSTRESLRHLSELLADTRLLVDEPAPAALIELLQRLDEYRRAGHRVWVLKIEEERRGWPGLWDIDVDADDDVFTEIDELITDFIDLETTRSKG